MQFSIKMEVDSEGGSHTVSMRETTLGIGLASCVSPQVAAERFADFVEEMGSCESKWAQLESQDWDNLDKKAKEEPIA